VAFIRGRILSSQSEQSEMFSKSPDWLKKSRPSKKSYLYFDHVVNRLIMLSLPVCLTFQGTGLPVWEKVNFNVAAKCESFFTDLY